MPKPIAASEEDYQLVKSQCRQNPPGSKFSKESMVDCLHRILSEWKEVKARDKLNQ